ncbi:MAG: phage holin family protein [Bacteroidota bacterium]|nr:phage holin family protein [Bacteroidota bacterium]
MESHNISDNIHELTGSVKEYVKIRVSLLKISITEKMSKVISKMLITMAFFILFLFVILFISVAFIFWFRDHAGPAYAGALIVASFYVILGFVVYLLRKKLFVNPVVTMLSKMLLEEEKEAENE